MEKDPCNVVVSAPMRARTMPEWPRNDIARGTAITKKKKQLRNMTLSAAAFLCMGIALFTANEDNLQTVQVTAEFDYDETLGRLQFVSSMIPESAMVFMQGSEDILVQAPIDEPLEELHAWSTSEPWIEYASYGEICACADATVMNIVENHAQSYTVRLMHKDGYESVYSGLCALNVREGDTLLEGETLGYADGMAAFELRRDGLSVQPVFRTSGA